MPLQPGTQFGSYQILALIGAGGMGEVYRALDLKLKRNVAIKVLPETFADEPERISRFEREAELLASLNHTNIAIVHDFQQGGEHHFLVMELIEGETLADRLKRGPLPIEETLEVARQVVEALEAAHQKGIIHRDLKPGNIKITADGKVKVLDFGLAKILESATPSLDASNSPTLISGSVSGVILGTAAYMSPEQARGKTVDKRTDIWAFGCVIYEMLSGRQAFARDNPSDTIAALLREEPDWQALPAETPRQIRELLRRCLRKDPRQRLHDAADVRIEIEDSTLDGTDVAVRVQSVNRRLVSVVAGLLAGVAIASGFWWVRSRLSNQTPTPLHLSLTLKAQPAPLSHMNSDRAFVISPDGKKIVYTVNRNGKRQLFLQFLGQAEGRLIDSADYATAPFFSPDSEWIAFGTSLELQKVAVSGGSPVKICGLFGTGFVGGDWGPDNTIIFVPDYNAGLWSVSASGGTPRALLKTDPEKDVVFYGEPQILPSAKGILLSVASGHAVKADDQDIAVLPAGTTEPRVLIRGGGNARYIPTGHIVYVRSGALLAVAFDLSKLAVTGTPVSVIDGLAKTWSEGSAYSISANGTLLYEPDSGRKAGAIFAMVDRIGTVQPITMSGNYGEFSISPDGRSLATRVFAMNDDIWIYNVASGTPLRLTFEPLDEIFPQWTADGTRIAFGTRTGRIFWKSSDGTGQREELLHSEYPRFPSSFSRDGKSMAFIENHPSRGRDIWLMPLNGDRQPRPFLTTDADEWGAKISPDGRWLAYASTETGRPEIFIVPLGTTGGRKRLSSEGGNNPAWAANGRELFFVKGDQLAAVSIDAEGNPVGRERILFTVPKIENLGVDPENPLYDVMPDGQHFVFLLNPQYSLSTHYNVVLNWVEELKKKF